MLSFEKILKKINELKLFLNEFYEINKIIKIA